MSLSGGMRAAASAAERLLRVGIVGGGPCGLTLASILAREGNESGINVRVLESGARDRDQGNGWDVDKAGGEALMRAGVSIEKLQRDGSDVLRFYKAAENADISYCVRVPSFLKNLGINPVDLNLETSRKKMIDELLEQIEGGAKNETSQSSRTGNTQTIVKSTSNVSIEHEVQVGGVERCTSPPDGGDESIRLLDRNGNALGEFDVIIDATGVVSKLRKYRFATDSFYTNCTFVQGIILDPEKSCDEKFVQRLGEGTLGLAGPTKDGKGSIQVWFQRHGESQEDRRTEFALRVHTDNPGDIVDQLDIGRFHGVTFEKEKVAKLKNFLMDQLGNDGWSQIYRDAVAAMDGGCVLPIFMHPAKKDLKEQPGSYDIPLLSIGDALHALPPWSGSSGNIALADASDTATMLLEYAKGDRSKADLVSKLREQEGKLLTRADGPLRDRCLRAAKNNMRIEKSVPISEYDFVMYVAPPNHDGSTSSYSFFLSLFLNALTFLNSFEGYGLKLNA